MDTVNRFDFLELVKALHREEINLNQTKGKEYATDQDVLADFRAVAEDMDLPLRVVLYIFMQKHWRAIASYCRTGTCKSESLRSRILDLNLYSKLLLVIQAEEHPELAYGDLENMPQYGSWLGHDNDGDADGDGE